MANGNPIDAALTDNPIDQALSAPAATQQAAPPQAMPAGAMQQRPGGPIITADQARRNAMRRNPRTGMPMSDVPGTGIEAITPTGIALGAALGGPVGAGIGGGVGGAVEHKLEQVQGAPQTHGSYTGSVAGGAALGMGTEYGGELVGKGVKALAPATARVLSKLSGADAAVEEARSAFRKAGSEAIQERNLQAALAGRKEALKRGVEELQPRLQEHLQEVHDAVRGDLDARWEKLRTAVGTDVKANVQSLATKMAEATKNVSEANRGLFDKVIADAHGVGDATNMDWQEAQAVYTKLGARLAKGGLPGDVWRGLKAYQNAVGSEMGEMTEAKALGKFYAELKTDWSAYMNDFQNSRVAVARGGSPVAHALDKADAPMAAKHFEGPAGDRAVQTLSKYKDYGARPELAQTYRDIVAEAKSAPKGKTVQVPQPPTTQEIQAIRQKANRAFLRQAGIGVGGAALTWDVLKNLFGSSAAPAPGGR